MGIEHALLPEQGLVLPGDLVIGADGIHSAIRAQMHPAQPPIHWGGAIMWRGTTPGVPIRTGASFVGLGSLRHRVVLYPISAPDPATGARLVGTTAYELERRGGRWGLATLCIGGGMGIATIIERV